MTQTPASPPAPLRLPVPQDKAVFQRLSTDFYPWTEVVTELEALEKHNLTGVLDVQQQGRWARFVWVRGQLRGGMAASGSDVTLGDAMRGLPRAQVSLVQTEPLVAEVLWESRKTPPQRLNVAWPEVQTLLMREQFQGALISGPHCSFWEGGRVMTGTLPQTGAPCFTLASSNRLNREVLLRVWSTLIQATHRIAPRFDETWKQVSMQLSTRFPVLDPFASEIRVSRGQLTVEEEVPMQELRPAMLEAYRYCLQKLNLRLSEIAVGDLRDTPDWAAAGLEKL